LLTSFDVNRAASSNSSRSDTKDAIIVERLSKRFELGALSHETMLRERLVNLFRGILRFRAEPREVLWALRDVSFRIGEGEVVGIIGRNGAGKSTLLKILSKITYPTSGRVRVRGRVASLLEVGTGFHEELTGRENIFLNGSILGMKKKEVDAKLDAIVNFAGVERFVDTPIKRYSSGMRLRLGFAVAAHLDPDILIIDEVLAVGDAGFQKKCLNAMEDLRSGGRTVLFVSHNMAAVENLCSRGIWIDEGRIRQDGPAHEVIAAYMETFAGSQQAATDLSKVQSRRGSGEIRYTSFEFLSKSGQPLTVIRSGDNVILRLHFHAKSPVQYPYFGLRLYTELGTLVTETGTWHHGITIPEIPPGDGYIDVDFEALNLVPARYILTIGISGEGTHLYDALDHCARLDVENANIYSSGRTFDSSFGIAFFPQQWRLSGARMVTVSSQAEDGSHAVQFQTDSEAG
jgi:lipopolysaccharide transport system ATP-binding protein